MKRRFTGRYHPRVVVLASVAIMAISVVIYFQLGSGFLPDMDEGAFVLDYRTPAGTSLAVYCKKFVSESVKFSAGLRKRESLIDQCIEL